MVTGEQVRVEALTWIGTPFQHAQSCKGHGADCVGLVYGVFKALGCVPADFHPEPYSQQWHMHKNEELLLKQAEAFGCTPVWDGEMHVGDLLFFQYGRVCSHIGIYLGDDEMIHAFYQLQVAVKQPLTGDLKARLKRVMKTPWVSE